jgi:hypothetical protein
VGETFESHADREGEVDGLVVDGYTRDPPADIRRDHAARQMIVAEPW